MKTVAIDDEYNNKPIFSVYKAEKKEDIKKEDRAVVGFGEKKARALLKHLPEFKDWCERNGFTEEA